jgi:hypothetical protein
MVKFPDGKRFAFTIIDDTDVATVENVKPIYRLLESLGMRTTKTVWPVGCPEGSKNFSRSKTLEDPEYLDFVLDLHRRGFEVTWHGATMESSRRERTEAALEQFRKLFGSYPRVHAGHAENRENLYWGPSRVDSPLLKALMLRMNPQPRDYYSGHDPNSPYWWGDLCARHFRYVRNLTFNRLNLATINPSMPYRDESRPLAPLWFSASDAEDAPAFSELLRRDQQDELERQGGFCILATHFGKGFVQNGEVHQATADRLRELSARPGWFVPVGELLDFLAAQRSSYDMPRIEWWRMQWRWAFDLGMRKMKRSPGTNTQPAASARSAIAPPQ